MKRYLIALFLSLSIILLYRIIDINLFTFDFPRRVSNNLFTDLRNDPFVDEAIILFNTGKLNPEEIKLKVDTLLTFGPKVIGINICGLGKGNMRPFASLGNEKIVFSSCYRSGKRMLSQITEDDNVVTHFRSNNTEDFEVVVSDSWAHVSQRGNEQERIYYRPRGYYAAIDLAELDIVNPEVLKDKIVLIGYMGDYVTSKIYNYKDCRITPVNEF